MKKLTESAIKILAKNSITEQGKLLSEAPLDASDVESGFEFLGDVIERYYQDSISYYICDIEPMPGPAGRTFISDKTPEGARKFYNVDLSTELRELKTRSTKEHFMDLMSQYGKDANEVLSTMISQDAVEEIDSIILTQMKTMATKHNDLVLKANSGKSMRDVFGDIETNIALIGAEMAKTLKRGIYANVIVGSKVAAALAVSFALKQPQKEISDEGLRDYIADLWGMYPIFIDSNSVLGSDNAVLITHTGNKFGDSPLVIGHYSTTVNYVDDYSVEETAVNIRDRRAIIQNPIDTEKFSSTGVDDSQFCHYFEVDFSNLSNLLF